MSDRINLAELRARAESAFGGRRRPVSPTQALALIDAVEAAESYWRQSLAYRDDPEADAASVRCWNALARFDFGEPS